MGEESITLPEIIDALRKRWKIIVLTTLIITTFTIFVSLYLIKPKYEASTKVFVGKESSNNIQEYTSSDIQMYQQLLKTYSNVIMTKNFVESAIEGGNITSTKEEILSNLNVAPKTDTQILEIKYSSYDKAEAKQVAEELTNEFIIVSTKLIPNANVQIIEKASLPENPVSPNKILNISIGLLLGIITGLGVAIILDFKDTTFSYKEELEKEIKLPVLGVIPKFNGIRRR
ncbi:YveK family protein [Clostridium vincentii]|uniref:Capsular polysaccharide type 8 biosynthesis protein cap8A n=1 Tax=Clostridium vincentii TaxID=52704 RepID=A0A2T0BJT5_9CLOT|nr:Wzz/FepE/Etk N-terminal domain-containing protein [Clostridium vincentii]PRR84072.1 Capsular polysaccharide type 8 biosynthesis protein cap8A [Clostridium vincentii]